ncbi:MAG: choice-of-anchor X domain-containing protein [Planctomycetota bacterium]|jgi:hypothetical protein
MAHEPGRIPAAIAAPLLVGVLLGALLAAPSAAQTQLHHVIGDGSSNSDFGAAVDDAGDIDGDGLSDFVVGARAQGKIWVYSGADGSEIWSVSQGSGTTLFGYAVAGAGDVNGDCVPDVIVGEPAFGVGGRAIVYSGASGTAVETYTSSTPLAEFGHSVDGVGDLDDDGRADVAIGAPFDRISPIDPTTGRVHVYTDDALPPEHVFDGQSDGDQFGHAVAALRDATGDGVADLAIGAPGTNSNGVDAGRVQVYSLATGTIEATIDGQAPLEQFGWSVADAGLVDEDALSDLIAGAPFGDPLGVVNAGTARVYEAATWTGRFSVIGANDEDQLGFSVGGGRDVDFDGRDDVVVGAPQLSLITNAEGYARVVSGDTGEDLFPALVGSGSDHEFGYAVALLSDIDEDCVGDILVGARDGLYAKAYKQAGLGETRSRLTWQDGTPIVGVTIEAYYFVPGITIDEPTLIPPDPCLGPTVTDEDGWFCLPPELRAPTQPGELEPGERRGIRARVTYTMNTGETTSVDVVNYPDWNVRRPYTTPTVGRMQIAVPLPVFFNPGVAGQVNNGLGDSDGHWRALLTLDAGASDSALNSLVGGDQGLLADFRELRQIKIDQRLPAHLFFPMPSKPLTLWPDDGVSWGYDNYVRQTAGKVSGSADAAEDHYTLRVLPELEALSPGAGAELELHVSGHSLGGVITRQWISRPTPNARLARYVTFDTPHGAIGTFDFGTGAFSFLLRKLFRFWTGSGMNGTSGLDGSYPDSDDRGWNYFRRLSSNKSTLLFSASDDPAIWPDSSPMGLGAIIYEAIWLSPWPPYLIFIHVPNGCFKRFLGGWGLDVPDAGHSLQNEARAMVSASRFLAYGNQPWLGTESEPGLQTTAAGFQSGDVGCNGDEAGSGSPALSRVEFEFDLDPGELVVQPLDVDVTGLATLAASFTNGDQQLFALVVNGVPQTPVGTPIFEHLEGGIVLLSYDVPVQAGAPTSLWVQALNPTWVNVTITYPDDLHVRTGASALHHDVNALVSIRAGLFDAAGDLEGGLGGTGEATVLAPDGSETVLTLLDDGLHDDGDPNDGLYGAIYAATSDPGRYAVTADLTISLLSGLSAQRTGDSIFLVDSPGSIDSFGSQVPVDEDGDLLADKLVVNTTVSILLAGEYALEADVFAGASLEGRAQARFSVSVAPTVVVVPLPISSELLHYANPGGGSVQVTLKNVELSDDVQGLHMDEVPNGPATSSLTLSGFDPPDVVLGAVLPGIGSESDVVVLVGKSLGEATGVRFGTESSPSINVLDDSALEVEVPPSAGQASPVDVTVETPFGDAVGAGLFSYLELPTGACQTNLGFQGPGNVELSVCGGDLTVPGNTATLEIENGASFSFAYLFAGVVNNPTPAQGGTLVPVPWLVFVTLPLDGGGGLTLPDALVAGAGPVVPLYLQAVVPNGPVFEFSNAVEVLIGL